MTAGVYRGATPITGVYVGGTLATGMYLGSTKLWTSPAPGGGVSMLQAVSGASQSLAGTPNANPYSTVVCLLQAPGEAVTASIGSTTLPKVFDNGNSSFSMGACGAAVGVGGAVAFQGAISFIPPIGLQLSGVSTMTTAVASSPASQSVTCPAGGYVIQIVGYQVARFTPQVGADQTLLTDYYNTQYTIGLYARGASTSTTFVSNLDGSQGAAFALIFS